MREGKEGRKKGKKKVEEREGSKGGGKERKDKGRLYLAFIFHCSFKARL